MLFKAIFKTFFFFFEECGYICPWQAPIGGKPIHLSADCQLLGLAMPYQLYLRLLDDALKQGIRSSQKWRERCRLTAAAQVRGD